MANKPGKLTEKHWKALELLEDGKQTMKQIAEIVGFSYDHFRRLYEGNIEKCGEVAALFQGELAKAVVRDTAKVKGLTKETKKLALYKINEYLRSIQNARPSKIIADQAAKMLVAMAKVVPSVEINSLSIHKGLTDKDLINEFKRLTALAEHALSGKPVPGSEEGGSGILFDAPPGGNRLPKE